MKKIMESIAGAKAVASRAVDAEPNYVTELQRHKHDILKGAGSLIFVFALLIIAGMGTTAWIYYGLVLETLTPQINTNVNLVGSLLAQKLSYVTAQGVPLAEIRGVQEFIGEFTASTKAISYIIITDVGGEALHRINLLGHEIPLSAADSVTPVYGVDGQKVGDIHIFLSLQTFHRIVTDLKYEIITLSIIALFLSVDLLNSFYVMRIYDPLSDIFNHLLRLCRGEFTRHLTLFQNDEVNDLCRKINAFTSKCNEKFSDFFYDAEETRRAQIDSDKANRIKAAVKKITDKYKFTRRHLGTKMIESAMCIKIPLLLFVMGQELSAAFLPVYFRQLTNNTVLSQEFMVGLSFVGFLFAPLVSMYFSSYLRLFLSMRNYLVTGAALCMLTLYGLSQVTTIEYAILLRSINGLGYGLIFLGAQIHIARLSNSANRARNAAIFARTMYAAVFFCPVIGGILSEQLGYQLIFILSAIICAVSIIAMWVFLPAGERKKLYPGELGQSQQTQKTARQQTKTVNAINRNIVVLALLGSVPVKLIHFGIIMFIIPLFLVDIGFRIVEVGRVLMLFGFMLLVFMPYVGKYMDKHQNAEYILRVGNFLSLAAIAALFVQNGLVIIAAVALFGISQSMVTPALLTLVQHANVQGEVSQSRFYDIVTENLTQFRLFERIGLMVMILLLSAIVGLGNYYYAFGFIFICQIIAVVSLHLLYKDTSGDYRVIDDEVQESQSAIADFPQKIGGMAL